MITWLVLKTGMQAWLVKLILLAVATGGILYGVRLYGNRQWAKGEQQGRVSGQEFMRKKKDAEWKEREEDWQKRLKAESETAKINAVRRVEIDKAWKDALEKIQNKIDYGNTVVANTPDSELSDAIRLKLKELRQ